MRRRRIIGVACMVALFVLGVTVAFSQTGEPTVSTQTFTHEDVVTYTIPTETVVSTETVISTVTVTTPTTTEPPPPEGTTANLLNQRFVCTGSLEEQFGPLPIIVEQHLTNSHPSASHARGAAELSGCFGDGDPDTTDLILHQYGDGRDLGTAGDAVVIRAFSHDLTIEGFSNCGWINPGGPGPGDEAHQDGFDIRAARDILIRDYEIGDWETQAPTCQGAGGLFYPSAFVNGWPGGDRNPELVQRVVCERCRMVAWKPFDPETNFGGRAGYIVESMDSGAVDSCWSARLPFQVDARAIRPVTENNLLIDRDSTTPQPSPSNCES